MIYDLTCTRVSIYNSICTVFISLFFQKFQLCFSLSLLSKFEPLLVVYPEFFTTQTLNEFFKNPNIKHI